MPDISIVVPVFNQLTYTLNMYDSLRINTNDVDYELVFIDNHSTDETPAWLQKFKNENDRVKVITNEENLGVTKAWNQGILNSTGKYVIIMNNDVILPPGWALGIKTAMDTFPEAWCVSPKSTTGQLPLNFLSMAANASTEPLSLLHNCFCGWCFTLRREELPVIFHDTPNNVFDESFEIWYNDSDLLNRLAVLGKAPQQVSNVLIHHYESVTLRSIPNIMEKIYKDEAAFYKRN